MITSTPALMPSLSPSTEGAEQVQRPWILEEELQFAEQRLGQLEAEWKAIGCNAARAGSIKLTPSGREQA